VERNALGASAFPAFITQSCFHKTVIQDGWPNSCYVSEAFPTKSATISHIFRDFLSPFSCFAFCVFVILTHTSIS
jgi:hypothetical protein